MARINILPKEIYTKIAAGEVIDGPYSVVRELIDNSIDANPESIKIITRIGGKEVIVVQDDGEGMSWEDAELAVKKHTTSKISNIVDLQKIETMGFRGEALSSICAVSDFDLITKSKENDTGIRLLSKFGKIIKVEPAPFSQGTKINVKNIFGNMPARQKFLKSNRSESSKIKDVIIKKSLCFNRIAFHYESEDRLIFSLPSKKHRRDRISSLFGQEIDKHLLEVNYEYDNFAIRGYVTDRDYTLSNRNGQYLYINNRPIYNRSFQFVINESARRLITQGRYVYAFIFVDIAPELIDVNVHPAKLEVKIKIEKEVSSALYRAVQNAYQNRIYNIKTEIDSENEKDRYENFLDKEKNYNSGINDTTVNINNKGLYLVKDDKLSEYGKADEEQLKNDSGFSVRDVQLPGEEVSAGYFNIYINRLRYVGSIFNGFLIFEEGESILLIDQHAAHERVLYEQFLEKYKTVNPANNLLIPINLTPPPGMYDEIMESKEDFITAGIEIEPFGDGSFNINSIPAFLPEDKESKIILEFFNEYFEKRYFPESGSIKDRFLKYSACKAAVKEGEKMEQKEAFFLIKLLFKCKVPYICPHGRPTILRVKKNYIERIFKRR